MHHKVITFKTENLTLKDAEWLKHSHAVSGKAS